MQILIILLLLITRFFGSNLHPISPYWEEVALGYDAYSISQTARDHHGNFLPLTAFVSFGDYKPSLYFYTIVPFIKVLGSNLLAVRLPTILASLMMVLGVAFLAKKIAILFLEIKEPKQLSLIFNLGLLVGALSPWLLYFSRSAWESTLASAFVLWGSIFGLLFWEKNKIKFFAFSLLCFVLATYTYHATRLSAPLIGILGVVFYCIDAFRTPKTWNFVRRHYGKLIALVLAAGILWAPVGQSMFLQSGQQRIAETSIFNDLSIIETSNALRAKHDYSLWSRIVYHRFVLFGLEISKNFFSHFDFDYLFVHGDHNPRHSIQTFGNFYALDSMLLLIGLVFLFKKEKRLVVFLVLALIATILPASFTTATPHALRTLAAWPVFMLILVFGAWQLYQLTHALLQKRWLFTLVLVLYLSLASKFFTDLLYHYPSTYRHEWQFGYEEMIDKLGEVQANFDQIYVTRENGRPSMYYFFYRHIDPSLVQSFDSQAPKDQGEFLEFQNIKFIDLPSQITLEESQKILVISSEQFYQNNFSATQWQLIDQTADKEWVFYVNSLQK